MASPLRVPDDDDNAAELEKKVRDHVLRFVQQRAATPVAPSELFSAIRQQLNAPFSLSQLAMWDLISRGDIKFTSDYRLVPR